MQLGIDASNIRAGGGITHLCELLGAAEPERHGIERIVVWGGRKTLELLPERPWLRKVLEPMLDANLFSRLYWQRQHLARRAKQECDLLFIPGGNYHGSFRPFVAMAQNLLPFDRVERLRYGLSFVQVRLLMLRLGQGRTFRRAAGVIHLTDFARDVVEKNQIFSDVPSAVVPHGISERFRLEPRLPRFLDDCTAARPFRWLYVSIVDLYKHQWHAVEAIYRLRQKGIPVAIDLVGPAYPPAMRRLERVIERLGDSEAVRYWGTIPYPDVAHLYREADGFLFASSCETISMILMEAMAAGLPIACSNKGPMTEVLGDAGIYFDPESPDQIADVMEALMRDPDKRAALAANAYARAARFTWGRCANETLSFLAQIAQSKERVD